MPVYLRHKDVTEAVIQKGDFDLMEGTSAT